MNSLYIFKKLKVWSQLLRWNKPSGRLILLIPAGWSLWLTPSAPPSIKLIVSIIAGGLSVSAAGCIANDIWDQKFDSQVTRTKNRPLAQGSIQISTALTLLFVMLLLSLLIIFSLPSTSTNLCIALAILALPIILIYPSAKRWFAYPQAILAICWGFSVLIPWAASESSLAGGVPLFSCWIATIMWTFGFDTVYGMADLDDDKALGLKSSVITLGEKAKTIVALSYAITAISLAVAAHHSGVSLLFWLTWIIASIGMQKEILTLSTSQINITTFGRHFRNQVWLGGLMLSGIILGRIT